MARLVLVGLALMVLSGCTDTSPANGKDADSVMIDPNRPDTTFTDIVTGPAVGPDLNATTAAPPRLVEGEWWRIRFESPFTGDKTEVVRVVANATSKGYIFGMPHEGWYKEAIAYHAPAFGDVALNLSYATHNVVFEPVRFPLKAGDSWTTAFAAQPLIATVESADDVTATVSFQPPPNNDPTAPATDALGLTSSGIQLKLVFDARMHEVVKMESQVGVWEVVEHGYGFEGWVTVPRGEHTAIDYGTFGPAAPDQPVLTRTVKVDGGFNRLTLMHVVGGLAPGSFHIRSKSPEGKEYYTESSQSLEVRFFESSQPDGDWTQEDFVGGAGYTYTMGIAYHQFDIRLPDGLRRSDHNHAVLR